jgi:hypothetical protein
VFFSVLHLQRRSIMLIYDLYKYNAAGLSSCALQRKKG